MTDNVSKSAIIPPTNSRPWQHQIDRTSQLEERIADLETQLATMEKRLAAIEAMLGSDNFSILDTHTLYTEHFE